MLISDKLALVQLAREGSGPLRDALAQVVAFKPSAADADADADGDDADEHSEASALRAAQVPVLVYVSDPAAWYLSLWRQGCRGKGPIYRRLTKAVNWKRATERSTKAQEVSQSRDWSAEHAKTVWYGEAKSPAAFREWMQAVLDTPLVRRVLRPNSTPALGRWAGWMSQALADKLLIDPDSPVELPKSAKALLEMEQQAYPAGVHFVRAERVGEDVLRALDAIGLPLTDAQRATFAALEPVLATNVAEYYDDATQALVMHYERFIDAHLAPDVLRQRPPKAPAA